MKELKLRRKRIHGQSAMKLIYVLGAMLLLVIAQLTISMKLLYKLTSNDESLLSNNQFIQPTASFKEQIQSNNDHHQQQQMVILAGPHKTGNEQPIIILVYQQNLCSNLLTGTYNCNHTYTTGTSSVQTNLWLWTQKSYNFTIPEAYKSSTHHQVLNDWVWPLPEEIGKLAKAHTVWNWTPAKGFYPMMEVLLDSNVKIAPRTLHTTYSRKEILDMYRNEIEYYWNQNLNVVFGTESMDNIVKVSNGADILKAFSKDIIPRNIDPQHITVVVAYRTPKVKHLISMWHQNILNKPVKKSFYDWITTTKNNFGAMDALKMVEMFLEHTQWNVALLDLEGLRVNEWDESNLVACKILQGKCSNRTLTNIYGEELKESIVANVRSHEQEPNVPQEALDEMEEVLRFYDCNNYQDMLQQEWNGHDRLKIYYPIGLDETMKFCSSISNSYRTKQSRPQMISLIKSIAIKYGRVSLTEDK